MHSSVELTPTECRRLLATKSVGRIAFQTGNGLRIFPVNYVVRDNSVVFRTVPYGVIARSIRVADVAFQVDDLDDEMRTGWSVLAVGRCQRLDDAAELTEIRQSGSPTPWAEGTRDLHFAIRWKGLSGRRLGEA